MGGFPGELTKSTSIFGLKLFEVIGIAVGILLLLLFLLSLSLWLSHRKRVRGQQMMKLPVHESPPKQTSPIHQPKLQEASPKQPFIEPSSSGNISEDRITVEKEIVHIRHGSTENPSSVEIVPTALHRALPAIDVDKTPSIVSPTASEIGTTASEIGQVSAGRVSGRVSDIRKSASDLGRAALDTPKTAADIRKTASDLSKKPSVSKSESPSSATNTTSTKETLERTWSFSARSTSPTDATMEVSHLGWGHWYSIQALETATNSFSDSSIVGKGGYGIVYHGILPDGSPIAVKKLVNNRGQVEREFKVEVEAIGRVRHKNLVSLLGYCMEGPHRLLVYEYIDNGNLDQWLHGSLGEKKSVPWDTRMKIIIGTAKGLAYLHEGLEPKVVHRDVKSSNILIDSQWNPKISDFGLAKLLGAENTHVTTRVMGTFGYVAPEYASTGLLNEKSDVYSFGVLLMELITGRDPVDYNRPSGEVNLVDWLKMMVGSRRSDEVADPRLEMKPSLRSLKRALLVALRCVDPDALQRPKMSQVIHMLETDENPFREERRSSRDLLPRTRSNPHHLQTILQSQGISLDNPGSTAAPMSGQRENTYMRRVPSRDALMSLGRGSPVGDTDPQADTSSGTSYEPSRSAKWRRFQS